MWPPQCGHLNRSGDLMFAQFDGTAAKLQRGWRRHVEGRSTSPAGETDLGAFRIELSYSSPAYSMNGMSDGL